MVETFWIPLRFRMTYLSATCRTAKDRLASNNSQSGSRVRLVVIGALTDAQLERSTGNAAPAATRRSWQRSFSSAPSVQQSRIERDGYNIHDVIDQIASAMRATAVVFQTAAMIVRRTRPIEPTVMEI